ncbi:KamA family protein [Natranaerovirga hydrolytica]|uniref:KamA family protein n=1 Tax=Natranaerovirga hydrolytica TaxID=680378 RepID=A0A4R1M9B2_9FIRM|nr:KamA family radical SAM protein [Natranaerovirga hydrolytica]TCK87960.1 KamA family protein [Natranaerovirga hydrolytica]
MEWKELLKQNATTLEDLKSYLTFSQEEESKLKDLIESYPLSTTQYYLSLINPDDPNDPIRKMSIPSVNEFDITGLTDTSGELENTKMEGVQHKYGPTVLLLSTSTCAMYCRHCFRKRLVGLSNQETLKMIDNAIAYIKEHKEASNVLITGGDSFLLDTSIIEKLLKALCEIEHIDFIRFGTRTPVVFPQRITRDNELLSVLEKYNKKKRIYLVTHFNHTNEITDESMAAIEALHKRNIIISNQAVLLKGVNDSKEELSRLINTLTRVGVVPYYVFQCRPVKGVANNFQVPLKEGYKIIEEAKLSLNGHGKRFRYIMSHITGKIEIVGQLNDEEMIFKYHQAKDPKNMGKIFTKKITDDAWLSDI